MVPSRTAAAKNSKIPRKQDLSVADSHRSEVPCRGAGASSQFRREEHPKVLCLSMDGSVKFVPAHQGDLTPSCDAG
jgi:hypothetical protein